MYDSYIIIITRYISNLSLFPPSDVWVINYKLHLGPLLLTWFNFNPSMDK